MKKHMIDSYAKYPVWADQHWMFFENADCIPSIYCNIASNMKNIRLGFVYVVEFGDMVKIGYTTEPRGRLKMLEKQSEKYGGVKSGRIFMSPAHMKYQETERTLHKYFGECRVPQKELFRIHFNQNIPLIMCMALDDELKAQIRDAIAEIKEAQE